MFEFFKEKKDREKQREQIFELRLIQILQIKIIVFYFGSSIFNTSLFIFCRMEKIEEAEKCTVEILKKNNEIEETKVNLMKYYLASLTKYK